MSVLADSALTTAANTIKNETGEGLNTATRVGQMFIDIIDSKPNVDESVTTVKVSLSSAEILSLNSVPKTLIAAQGADTFILPLSVVARKNFVSIQYTGNTNLIFGEGTVFDNAPISSFLGFSISTITTIPIVEGAELVLASAGINTALTVKAETGNPASGNGTVDFYITYRVITL